MSFELEKIWESKRVFRRQLTALPIAKKLEILDALHERTLVIKNSRTAPKSCRLGEQPLRYGNDSDFLGTP